MAGEVLHVHQVGVVLRLVFDLGINNSRVRDACGVGTRGPWNHVMGKPEMTGKQQMLFRFLKARPAH